MSLKCKLALSVNPEKISESLFRDFSLNGVEAAEISISSNKIEQIDFLNIKRLAEKHNIKLWSFHLPFSPFDTLDISNPEIAEQTVSLFKKYIQKANEAGIKIFVVHPGGEPIKDTDRENRIECAKKSLYELAEYASDLNCVIAVENLPRTCLGNCSKEILELSSVHKKLRVCCDTNHLLQESVNDFIYKIGDKIVTVHISDCDFINERHWLPGEGKIDWVAVISAFETIGYDGCWLYEVDFATPWSIKRNRDLNCTDFKNNYIDLMNKKYPIGLGKPKDNLGMWNIIPKK